MEARKPSSLGTVGFMIGAVVFAVIAGLLLSQVVSSKYSKEPLLPVIVAAAPVPSGQPLRREDLRLSYWPASSIPVGSFQTIEGVLRAGRVPLIPLVKAEPILDNHLSHPNSGMGIAPLLERGKRAMPIRVGDPVALARLVYPGAHVDVVSTVRQHSGANVTVLTKIVLQNLKVLAVGEDIDPLTISQRRRQREASSKEESALGGRQEDSQQMRGVVTLMVSPSELELLALASQEGKLDVALRNPHDKEIAESSGATPETLVGGGTPAGVATAAGEQDPGPMSLSNRAPRARAERRSRGDEAKTQITRTSSVPKEEPKGVIIHRAGHK